MAGEELDRGQLRRERLVRGDQHRLVGDAGSATAGGRIGTAK